MSLHYRTVSMRHLIKKSVFGLSDELVEMLRLSLLLANVACHLRHHKDSSGEARDNVEPSRSGIRDGPKLGWAVPRADKIYTGAVFYRTLHLTTLKAFRAVHASRNCGEKKIVLSWRSTRTTFTSRP